MSMKSFFAIALIFLTVDVANAQELNFVTLGNLESPRSADCVPISSLNSRQNPADLFAGFRKCVTANEYRKAAALFYTAMIYGTYDANRVADRSAGQAILVLQREAVRDLKPEAAAELESARQSLKGDQEFCTSLKELGKPTYHPRYMIAHGMGVLNEEPSENGLLIDFKAESKWQELLAVAKCVQ